MYLNQGRMITIIDNREHCHPLELPGEQHVIQDVEASGSNSGIQYLQGNGSFGGQMDAIHVS